MLFMVLALSSIFAISVDGFVTGSSDIALKNLACPGSEIEEACSSFCGKVDTTGFFYGALATSNNEHAFTCNCQESSFQGEKVQDQTPSVSGIFPFGASVLPQINTSPSSQEQLCPVGSVQLKTCERFCPIFKQKPYCIQDVNENLPQNSYAACVCYS